MKKLFVLVAALLTVSVATHAQTVSIMPKAGVSVSRLNFKNDAYRDEQSRAGLTFGAAVPIRTGSWFTVQPELLYVQRGGNFRLAESGSLGSKTETRLNYLELPVLARANMGPVFLLAGPSLGMSLNGKTETAGTKRDVNFGNRTDEYRRADLGLQVGGGLALNAGPGQLTVDARYGFGLTDIDNVSGNSNRTRNGVWAFTLGYAIPLGSK
jgi:hypothetical protein